MGDPISFILIPSLHHSITCKLDFVLSNAVQCLLHYGAHQPESPLFIRSALRDKVHSCELLYTPWHCLPLLLHALCLKDTIVHKTGLRQNGHRLAYHLPD